MKKILCKILLVLVFLFTAIGFGSAETALATGTEKIRAKVTVGFDNNYKIGYSAPINITLINNGDNIDGEVEIRVPSTRGKYMSYVKPISLQKGAEKSITINVPVSINRSKYDLNIYNNGKKVYEDVVSTIASNNATAFIGILSDDFNSLSYINKVPANGGVSLLSRTIRLDDKNFPDDIFTLNAFDVLVINDFDTNLLSKGQYDTLKQWVANGGTLLIGTGSKYNKTLSVFKDDFITGSQGSMSEITTSRIYELATNGDSKTGVKVDVLSLTIKSSNVLMKEENISMVQSLKKGRGVIGILAFDLGQAPFTNWNNSTAFVEELLRMLDGDKTESNNVYQYAQDNLYWLRNAMDQFSEMDSAKTSSFYIILFIYVLVVAPLSYLVLKKIDKREFMWITVPVFAIIFGFVVYISGSGTRLGEITTNMVSFLNIDEEGNVSSETFAGIYNANKRKVTVTGQNGQKIFPLSSDYYNNPNDPEVNEVMEAKIFSDLNGGIEYRNSSLLETRMLKIQEKSKSIGRVETKLFVKDGKIVGEIHNGTSLDLIDCIVIIPDGYYKIDRLKSGETIKLDSLSKTSANGNVFQIIQNVFFQFRSISNVKGDERKRVIDKNQEGNILQGMFNNKNGQSSNISFIGFSKTQIHDPLMINGSKAKKYERNILYFPLQIEISEGEMMKYPFGFVPYTIANNTTVNYDPYNNMFYGNGSAEILYRLDKDMQVEEIQFDTLNRKTSGSSNYSIFNVKENAYEELVTGKMTGETLKKYLLPDNQVKIRLELKDSDGSLPQMAATGRKNNA